MSKFKILGVGIDTRTLDYVPSDEFDFDYIMTSVSANNESLVRAYSRYASIITYTDFLDGIDTLIPDHLNQIGRPRVDLLLVDAKCDFVEYAQQLSSLVDFGYVDTIGIYGPTSIERVEEILEVLPTLKYVGLEMCPLNFNYELVSWINEKGLEILCFNPFGGHISAAGIIDSFSVPYLLGFASNYSTLVFLSGRDLFTAKEDKDYLTELIDKESSDIYKLEKSISKLYKPLKTSIGVSLSIDSGHTIPLSDPRAIFNPTDLSLNLGKAKYESQDLEIKEDSVEADVYDYYKDFVPPKDSDEDRSIVALIKPRIAEMITDHYRDWNMLVSKVSDNIFIISLNKIEVKKRLFKNKEKILYKSYLLSVLNKSLEFFEIDTSEMGQSAENTTQES